MSAQMKIMKYSSGHWRLDTGDWTLDTGDWTVDMILCISITKFCFFWFGQRWTLPIVWLIAFTYCNLYAKKKVTHGAWNLEIWISLTNTDTWQCDKNWQPHFMLAIIERYNVEFYLRLNYILTFDFICEYKLIIWVKKKKKTRKSLSQEKRLFVILPFADVIDECCRNADRRSQLLIRKWQQFTQFDVSFESLNRNETQMIMYTLM